MQTDATLINVDDNEPARYARSRILMRAGFTVHDAGTGQECLDLVAKHSPDLVLLDVHLPDLHGIEVCRRLKSSKDNTSLIVLQISASATAAPQATAALNNGADAYLTEPVDPDVLIATVRALLRLRTAERGLVNANQQLAALNQELRRSNDDLQHFAFLVSHDLQEPLRTITTFVGLIEEGTKGLLAESQQEYFGFVTGGAQRMRHLIDDLLTYSQVGRDPYATTGRVDLQSVVSWARENLAQKIAESQAEITVDPLPFVSGDFAQLGHVVQNLISNGLKYRKADQPIRIHITAGDGATPDLVVVCVRDNGIGIAPEYHEKVFEPFKRLHGREIPGTGIGLALCRRIVETHGGQIWVESAEGQGSKFLFTLPRAVAEATASC